MQVTYVLQDIRELVNGEYSVECLRPGLFHLNLISNPAEVHAGGETLKYESISFKHFFRFSITVLCDRDNWHSQAQ